MLVRSSESCLAATLDARADRDSAGLLRWLAIGAASVIALILALSHAGSVGAAAPTTYDNTICINYFTCYNSGTGATVSNTNSGYPTYVVANNARSGYPANTAISAPYFDNRYGFVQVVTDSSGNLIDINPATGQRIFPIFSDFAPGFINGNFFNGFNGNFFNGFNGNFAFPNTFANNGCPAGNFSCLGFNPFFGFPFGTGVFNGNVAVVAPNGNPIVVGPPFRVKEVAAPTVTTAVVAQPAAAPAAPAANYATALNTSSAPAAAPAASPGGGGVHALSAPSTTPAATTDGGSDDHRG